MITVVSFKSPPRETPFAPEWFHQFAYDQISNIDFEKIKNSDKKVGDTGKSQNSFVAIQTTFVCTTWIQ